MHAWKLQLQTAAGAGFLPRQLVIDGGMVGHGHGFPSQPRATRMLDDGMLLIEGVSFNMAGRWTLAIAVIGPDGPDSVRLEFQVTDAGQVVPGSDPVRPDRRALLDTFSLRHLGVPIDPSNRYANDEAAASLGKRLFFDPAFSSNGRVSCASCHDPERLFTDGRAMARGVGESRRNTPDLVGVAWRTWFYWDGRRDSLWSQALIPFEAQAEMGSSRVAVLRRVASSYRSDYEKVFGALPDLDGLPADAGPIGPRPHRQAWRQIDGKRQRQINNAFANVGKAIAAHESGLAVGPGRFDAYVEAAATSTSVDRNRG